MTATEIFVAALKGVRSRHGNIFPAATVQELAWRRWTKALTLHPEAVLDPNFEAEGQKYCEFLLLDEVLLFEAAKKGSKWTRKKWRKRR